MVKQRMYEDRAREELEAAGYTVIKSAGSLGAWDMVALGNGEIRLIQVKKTQWPRSEEMAVLNRFPHLCCPGCGAKLTKKEIWRYVVQRINNLRKGILSIRILE